jgi:hypothetical protein
MFAPAVSVYNSVFWVDWFQYYCTLFRCWWPIISIGGPLLMSVASLVKCILLCSLLLDFLRACIASVADTACIAPIADVVEGSCLFIFLWMIFLSYNFPTCFRGGCPLICSKPVACSRRLRFCAHFCLALSTSL